MTEEILNKLVPPHIEQDRARTSYQNCQYRMGKSDPAKLNI